MGGHYNIIKFHVLLGKSALECYKSLKEGLGTHSPSHETVCQWVNDIKNGWAETDDASHCAAPKSAMDERHVEKVKSVLECTCNISCMATATEVRISPASVYCISPTVCRDKKFVQSGFHMCSTITKEPCRFFLPPPICSIVEIKAMHSSITF